MAKKKLGLTGTSYKFKFIIVYPGGSYEVLEIDGGYSALDEYDWSTATTHKLRTGRKKKKHHYINMEWGLIWDGLLYTEDGVKINKVKNAEKQEGVKIYLMPHASEDASYQVFIIEEKRKLEKYLNEDSTARSYAIVFENADVISNFPWRDPSDKVYFTADEFDFV